jgi:TetR/AcrR family transcriptional repressor of nem operon
VRAGARLFLARSYQAVGVDELCAAADVRKGSFYHFFSSKSVLAKAVIDWHAEALWARLDAAAAGATGTHDSDAAGSRSAAGAADARDVPGSAAARLHAIADAVGEIQAGFEQRYGSAVGCPFGNLAAELATTDEALHEHLAAVFAEWERRLADLCRDAAAERTLRPGVDPDRFARILVAQFQGMILLAKTGRTTTAEIPLALRQLIDSHLTEGAGV